MISATCRLPLRRKVAAFLREVAGTTLHVANEWHSERPTLHSIFKYLNRRVALYDQVLLIYDIEFGVICNMLNELELKSLNFLSNEFNELSFTGYFRKKLDWST